MVGTRERILDASAELFQRQGYAATGVKQVVREADAQLASLYHFFPGGKEELGEETVRRGGVYYEDLVMAVIDAEADIVSGFRAMFAGAAAVLEGTGYADACPIETVALEVASTNERLRLATADVFEAWLVAAATRLADAGLPAAEARALAVTAVAALEGAFVLARAARTTEAVDRCGESVVALVASALDRAGIDWSRPSS